MFKSCAVHRCKNKANSDAVYSDGAAACRVCDEHSQGWDKIRNWRTWLGKYNHIDTDENKWIESHLNYDYSLVVDINGIIVALYQFHKIIMIVVKNNIVIHYEFGNHGYYIYHDEFVYENIDTKNKINEYTYVPIWRKVIRASNIYPNILPRDITGMIELFL